MTQREGEPPSVRPFSVTLPSLFGISKHGTRRHLLIGDRTYCGRPYAYSTESSDRPLCRVCEASRCGNWGYVYLLHFDSKLHHAQHYLGSTNDLARRIRNHNRSSTDVKIIRAFQAKGITFQLSRIWRYRGVWAARFAERDFKRRYKHGSRLCPICRSEKFKDRARLKEPDKVSSKGLVEDRVS